MPQKGGVKKGGRIISFSKQSRKKTNKKKKKKKKNGNSKKKDYLTKKKRRKDYKKLKMGANFWSTKKLWGLFPPPCLAQTVKKTVGGVNVKEKKVNRVDCFFWGVSIFFLQSKIRGGKTGKKTPIP